MPKGRPADRGQGSTDRRAEELQPDCRRGPVVYDVTATYRVDRMAWQSVLAGEGDARAAPRAIGALTRGHAVSGRQFTRRRILQRWGRVLLARPSWPYEPSVPGALPVPAVPMICPQARHSADSIREGLPLTDDIDLVMSDPQPVCVAIAR